MNAKLAHLDEQKVEDLIRRYYEKETVKNLIAEYEIDIRISGLVGLFPAVLSEVNCPICETKMERHYISRGRGMLDEGSCPKCRHWNYPYCECKHCKEADLRHKQEARQKKQNDINKIFENREQKPIMLEDLSLENKVYLGTILREGISEDYSYVSLITKSNAPLIPTAEFEFDIIKQLTTIKALIIHPNTDIDCFSYIDSEAKQYTCDTYEARWKLNIKIEGLSNEETVEYLTNPSYEIKPEEAYQMWRKIALQESLEYFYLNVNKILGIHYSAGKKTLAVLNDLLNNYSVAQIYGILFRSTNNALRYKAEHRVSMKQAANTIIGNAQSFAERALINDWTLAKYNRQKNLPESALSKFFFERILKIGYRGFNEEPHLIYNLDEHPNNERE